MNKLSLTLFGSPRITLDERTLHVGRRKAVALLAYLAFNRQPISRSILATLLWYEHDESAARAELRRVLSTLNQALGSHWLHTTQDTIALVPHEDLWIDVLVFRQAISALRTQNINAVAAMRDAIELANGDFLAGFSLPDAPEFEQWQLFVTQSLQRDLAWALEQLSSQLATHQPAEALEYAQRWLALDPLHEPAHQRLMQLYAAKGDLSAAFRQYQACVRLLKHELDAAPSAELTALYEQLRRGEYAQPSAVVSALSSSSSQPVGQSSLHNLPTQLTPFVGRAHELGELRRLLSDGQHRLLSITGPGGIGKTRLALQIARHLRDEMTQRWRNGVYFVNLSSLENGTELASAIVESMSLLLQGSAPLSEQLIDYLRQKELLLVLDNLEQLLSAEQIEPVVTWIDSLLQQAPAITLLVTSRQRLNLHGETVFNLIGLPFPAVADETLVRYDAVQLFVQSAQRAEQTFVLNAANQEDVVRICQLVQGMPLALDLAAVWTRMLTPAEIVAEIAQGLAILETQAHNLPTRHRSMMAVFEHSWRLLSAAEQDLFCKLSIFRGGCTRQAAQSIADATLPVLSQLCDKSLISRSQDGRFVMHELLRQFAAEQLPESTMVQVAAHHARYFSHLLAEHEGAFVNTKRMDAHRILRPEMDNIRHAWDWAVQQAAVQELSSALQALYHLCIDVFNSYEEGIRHFRKATAVMQHREEHAARLLFARLCSRQAMCHLFMGDSEQADVLFAQSLQIARQLDEKAEIAFVLARYCLVQLWQGKVEQARAMAEEGVALFRTLQLPGGLETALTHLGFVVQQFEEFATAEQLNLECLSMLRQTGDPDGLVTVLTNLGVNYLYMNQPDKALPSFEESLVLSQSIGNRSRIATSLANLQEVMGRLNRIAEAKHYGEQALAIFEELGQRQYKAVVLGNQGRLELQQGEHERARAYFQQALSLGEAVGVNFVIFAAIAGFAELSAAQEDLKRAVTLLTLTLAEPTVEPDVKARSEKLLHHLQQVLPPHNFADAQAHAQTIALETLINELLA